LGQSLAKLSDQLFPESVWKDFGEHMGKQSVEEGEDQEKEGGGCFLGASWGALGASWEFAGSLLDASSGPP